MNKRAKKADGQRSTLREKLCHTLDISPDIFPGGTLIEMRGRNRISLRGCGPVICYTDTEIGFSCSEGNVFVRGKRLCCSSYCPSLAVIDGHISCVCFEEKMRGER